MDERAKEKLKMILSEMMKTSDINIHRWKTEKQREREREKASGEKIDSRSREKGGRREREM